MDSYSAKSAITTAHAAECLRQLSQTAPVPRLEPQPVQGWKGRRIPLLIVGPFNEDLLTLLEILKHTNWGIRWRATCADAEDLLRSESVPVALCERNLSDGTWQQLLLYTKSLSQQPRFIVTARLADEALWIEALSLGAHDVLPKPFHAKEVIRTISRARSLWSTGQGERWTDGKRRSA